MIRPIQNQKKSDLNSFLPFFFFSHVSQFAPNGTKLLTPKTPPQLPMSHSLSFADLTHSHTPSSWFPNPSVVPSVRHWSSSLVSFRAIIIIGLVLTMPIDTASETMVRIFFPSLHGIPNFTVNFSLNLFCSCLNPYVFYSGLHSFVFLSLYVSIYIYTY